MDMIIKTEKGIGPITTDHYADKPLYMMETNRYNINGADTLGKLGIEYPEARTSRKQVSYKRG